MSSQARTKGSRTKRRMSCPVRRTVCGTNRPTAGRYSKVSEHNRPHCRTKETGPSDTSSSSMSYVTTPPDNSIPFAYRSLSTSGTVSDEMFPTCTDATQHYYDPSNETTPTEHEEKFDFPETFSFKAPSGSSVRWRLTRRRSVDLSYSQCVSTKLDSLINEEMRHLVYLDDGQVEPEPTSTPHEPLTPYDQLEEITDYVKIGYSQSSL